MSEFTDFDEMKLVHRIAGRPEVAPIDEGPIAELVHRIAGRPEVAPIDEGPIAELVPRIAGRPEVAPIDEGPIAELVHRIAGRPEVAPIDEVERSFPGEVGASVVRGALGLAKLPFQVAKIVGSDVLGPVVEGITGTDLVKRATEPVINYLEETAESPTWKPSKEAGGAPVELDRIIQNPGEVAGQIASQATNPRFWASQLPEGAMSIIPFIVWTWIPRVLMSAGTIIKGIEAAKAAGEIAKAAELGVRLSRIHRISTMAGYGSAMAIEAAQGEEKVREYEEKTGETVKWGSRVLSILGTGVVAGALEAFALGKVLPKALLGRTAASPLAVIENTLNGRGGREIVNRVLAGVATEGLTEGAQTIVENAFPRHFFDKNQKLLEGVVESILIGAALGGLGGGAGAISVHREAGAFARESGKFSQEYQDEVKATAARIQEASRLAKEESQVEPISPEGPPEPTLAPAVERPGPQPTAPSPEEQYQAIFGGGPLVDIIESQPDPNAAIRSLVPQVGSQERAERFYDLYQEGDAGTALQEFPEFSAWATPAQKEVARTGPVLPGAITGRPRSRTLPVLGVTGGMAQEIARAKPEEEGGVGAVGPVTPGVPPSPGTPGPMGVTGGMAQDLATRRGTERGEALAEEVLGPIRDQQALRGQALDQAGGVIPEARGEAVEPEVLAKFPELAKKYPAGQEIPSAPAPAIAQESLEVENWREASQGQEMPPTAPPVTPAQVPGQGEIAPEKASNAFVEGNLPVGEVVPEAAPTPAPAKVKEPWEMTRKEFGADESIYYRSSHFQKEYGMNERANGIFFGNDLGAVNLFGSRKDSTNIFAARLEYKNPYYLTWLEIEDLGGKGLRNLIPELKKEGYDAIVENNESLRNHPEGLYDEPWQVAVFSESQIHPISEVKEIKGGGLTNPEKIQANLYKTQIEQALAAGKPVPPEVLADYPDLAAKYGKEKPAPPIAPKPKAPAAPKPLSSAITGKPAATTGKEPAPTSVESARQTALETHLSSLSSLMDESKKSVSISKLERELAKIKESEVEGLEDVRTAIKDYRSIKKEGLSLEDYADEKSSAFEEIQSALEGLEVAEIPPPKPPKPLPAGIAPKAKAPAGKTKAELEHEIHLLKSKRKSKAGYFQSQAEQKRISREIDDLRAQMPEDLGAKYRSLLSRYRRYRKGPEEGLKYGYDEAKYVEEKKTFAQELINAAKKAGQPIPKEIVADYPELALQEAAPAPKPLPKALTGKKGVKYSIKKARQYAPVFFSQMANHLEAKLPGKGSGADLAKLIEGWGEKGQFKADELKWSGLIPWLREQQGTVTRQQMADFLKENQVEVREVVKGQGRPKRLEWEAGKAWGEDYWTSGEYSIALLPNGRFLMRSQKSDVQQERPTLEEAKQMAESFNQSDHAGKDETRFQGYFTDLPESFTNRREILLTVPHEAKPLNRADMRQYLTQKYGQEYLDKIDDWTTQDRDKYFALPGMIRPNREGGWSDNVASAFHVPSSHAYGDAAADVNRFAHIFTADYVDPATGKKNLVITELQSDWAAKGRKEGYKGELLTVSESSRLNELSNKAATDFTDAEWPEYYRLSAKEKAAKEGIPSLPFAKNWHEVALKRAIRFAAENGYDGVMVVNGEMVKQRYDLSKVYKSVMSEKTPDGYKVTAMQLDQNRILDVGTFKDAVEMDAAGISKGMAEKLAVGDGVKLEGVELELGGTWANNFYDKTIPSYLKKYVKQWGAEVGGKDVDFGTGKMGEYEGPIPTKEELRDMAKNIPGTSYIIASQAKDIYAAVSAGTPFKNAFAKYGSPNLAKEYGGKVEMERETNPLAHFPITPAMKDSVLYEGQPKFNVVEEAVRPGEGGAVNLQAVQKVFGPRIQVSQIGEHCYSITLPSNKTVVVLTGRDVKANREEVLRTYGRDLQAGEEVAGKWEPMSFGGVVSLAKGAGQKTLHHETFHTACDLVLTQKEMDTILKEHGDWEAAATAYENWKPAEPHTLFQKILDFFKRLAQVFRPSVAGVFTKTRSGEVWLRTEAGPGAGTTGMFALRPANAETVLTKYHQDLMAAEPSDKSIWRRFWEKDPSLKASWKELAEKTYDQMMDRFAPGERAQEKLVKAGIVVPSGEQFTSAVAFFRGQAGFNHEAVLGAGVYHDPVETAESGESFFSGATPTRMGDSLFKRVDPIRDLAKTRGMKAKEVFRDLRLLMVANKDLELSGEVGIREPGAIKGTKPEQSRAALQALEAKYGDNLKVLERVGGKWNPDGTFTPGLIQEWADQAILQRLLQGGIISQELYDKIKSQNQAYIPFMRLMDELDQYIKALGGGRVIKEIKGSERAIVDPFQMLIELSAKANYAYAKNRMLRSIHQMGQAAPELMGVKEVPAKFMPVTETLKQEIDKPLRDTLMQVVQALGVDFQMVKTLRGRRLGQFISGLREEVTAGNLTVERAREIQVRFATTEKVLTHEVGHAIDEQFNLVQKMVVEGTPEMKRELRAIADQRAGLDASPSYKRYVRKRTEQVAEFVNRFINDKDAVRALAPKTTAYFEDFLATKKVLEPLRELRTSHQLGTLDFQNRVWARSPLPPEPGTVPFYKDGKQVWLKLPPDMYQMMQNMMPEDLSLLMRVLKWPAEVLRTGAVTTPEFGLIKNPFRDLIQAWLFSRTGFGMHKWFRDLYLRLSHDPATMQTRAELAAGGGFMATLAQSTRTEEITVEDIEGKKKKTWYASHPVYALQKLSTYLENMTRLSLYKQARENGFSHAEAIHEARRTTLDFRRLGAHPVARYLNMLIPFWNANIQGVDKLFTELRGPNKAAVWRRLGTLSAVSIGLALLFHDDDRLKELEDWEKNYFWHIPLGKDGPIIRLPKPFEAGILFGSVPERLVEVAMGDNTTGLQAAVKAAFDALTPEMIPAALRPMVELKSNYNFFLGRPIEDVSLQNLPVEMRSKPWTTQLAKSISAHGGNLIGLSPVKIEHSVRSMTGGLGANYFLPGIDQVLRKAGILEDLPNPQQEAIERVFGIRALFTKPPTGYRAKSVGDFFENSQKVTQADLGWKALWNTGSMDKLDDFWKDNPEAMFAKLARQQMLALGKIKKERNAIYQSKALDSEQKKVRLDALDEKIVKLAKVGNILMDPAVAEAVKMPSRFVTEMGARKSMDLDGYYKLTVESVGDAYDKLKLEKDLPRILRMDEAQRQRFLIRAIRQARDEYQPILKKPEDVMKPYRFSSLLDKPTRAERAGWQSIMGFKKAPPGAVTGYRMKEEQ